MSHKTANPIESGHPFLIAKAITIKGLRRRRKIWAYLPFDYFSNPHKRYPVIYMNDGQNVFEGWKAPFDIAWEAHNTMRSLQHNNNISESILIGIEHGKRHRQGEYMPFLKNNFSFESNIYTDFVANDLKNFIDKKLRTLPHRDHRAIVGSSLGGLNALYSGFKHQDVFSKVGALSPSLWAAPQMYDLIEKVGKQYDMKFFLSVGSKEGRYTINNVINAYHSLQKAGYAKEEIYHSIVEGGKHEEKLWQNEFRKFYLWLQ